MPRNLVVPARCARCAKCSACAKFAAWPSRAGRAAVAAVDATMSSVGQLPGGDRRAILLPRERGQVAEQPAHSYPAGARATVAFIGMAAVDVTAMYFLQHNYPVVSTAPYFLSGMMAG